MKENVDGVVGLCWWQVIGLLVGWHWALFSSDCPFYFLSYIIVLNFRSPIDLFTCVWRHLAPCPMRLGGWKGVECLASPHLVALKIWPHIPCLQSGQDHNFPTKQLRCRCYLLCSNAVRPTLQIDEKGKQCLKVADHLPTASLLPLLHN
jgi:hypothetical protein